MDNYDIILSQIRIISAISIHTSWWSQNKYLLWEKIVLLQSAFKKREYYTYVVPYATKVLWLSAFFSNFLKISFGGQFLNFWWFEQSRFIVVFIFLSLSACCQSVSCHCQQKNFCLYFSDATLLAALFQKRCEIC